MCRLTFRQSTSAKVEAKIRLSPNNFAPFHELIGAKLVGLGTDPGQLGTDERWVSQSYTSASTSTTLTYRLGL
jgi:hypothetical protein